MLKLCPFDKKCYNEFHDIFLGLSSISMHANGKCNIQDDPRNVVSTQLEGSWELNQEITKVLSPSAHGPLGPAFKELK